MKKLIGLRHAGCGGWIGKGPRCWRCGKTWPNGVIEKKEVEEVWVETRNVKIMRYAKRYEYPDKTILEVIEERRFPDGERKIDVIKRTEYPKKKLKKALDELKKDREIIEFKQRTIG